MNIKQRFPNFFSGFVPEEVDIDTLEQLQEIKFIKQWINNINFYKLSLGRIDKPQKILMAEMKDNSYFAIAWIKGDIEKLGLPTWNKIIK